MEEARDHLIAQRLPAIGTTLPDRVRRLSAPRAVLAPDTERNWRVRPSSSAFDRGPL